MVRSFFKTSLIICYLRIYRKCIARIIKSYKSFPITPSNYPLNRSEKCWMISKIIQRNSTNLNKHLNKFRFKTVLSLWFSLFIWQLGASFLFKAFFAISGLLSRATDFDDDSVPWKKLVQKGHSYSLFVGLPKPPSLGKRRRAHRSVWTMRPPLVRIPYRYSTSNNTPDRGSTNEQNSFVRLWWKQYST